MNTQTRTEVTGERTANSDRELAASLRHEQIQVTSIKERRSSAAKGKGGSLFGKAGKVKPKEVALFTRQFSVMLGAGLPLVQALHAIGSQNGNPAFRAVLAKVQSDVESGGTLAKALEKHPRVFDALYTNMIAAGETGGILETVLQRLSVFIEKIVKLKSALKSALIYPVTILTVAVGVVIIILWKVIPTFRTMFEGFNVQLPLLTRLVIGISAVVQRFGLPMVILIAIGVFGIRQYYKKESGRHVIDRLTLKMPILGEVIRKLAIARFVRTLSTLLTSGVPILECLDITAKTSGNAILEDVIYILKKRIEEGGNMAEPMTQSNFFPPMVTQMVAVGESTGELDAMLTKVADYYEEEADAVVANLLTLMEPVMMVFLGVMVGGIVIAMYLPMFKMIQTLSGG
jgi:type IV pilus assembly protein PilC